VTRNGSAKFQEVLDMAKKSIVLLKNENELLPLKKSGLKIIGHWHDKTSPLGSWRIAADDESAVSVLKDFKSMKEINLCQRS
jgi:beta-glucosidase